MDESVRVGSPLTAAIAALDVEAVRGTYWAQDEFTFLPGFVPPALLAEMQDEVEAVRPHVHRNYIPRRKQGGSVSYYRLLEQAPAIVGLYRDPEFRAFVSRLVGAPLLPCPDDDPHACALYFYTEPGDHIGFHYDTSYYKGARYTILIGLLDRSQSRLVCRLHTRNGTHPVEERQLATTPGAMVLFNGDKLYHAITPLGPGEERVSLTLEYVTNQEMGRGKRLLSNLKDAFAYFGLVELLRGRRRR